MAVAAYGPGAAKQPFDEWQRPYLERFGEALRRHRSRAGINRRQLHLATGLSIRALFQIESAQQRVRPSTIRRIARALAESMGTETADDIAEELLELIGPAAAQESPAMESIEARRDRFVRKLAENSATELRPPPVDPQALAREFRYVERKVRVLEHHASHVEAKEEELRQKEAALRRLDKQIQQRELEVWQRRNPSAAPDQSARG